MMGLERDHVDDLSPNWRVYVPALLMVLLGLGVALMVVFSFLLVIYG